MLAVQGDGQSSPRVDSLRCRSIGGRPGKGIFQKSVRTAAAHCSYLGDGSGRDRLARLRGLANAATHRGRQIDVQRASKPNPPIFADAVVTFVVSIGERYY